MDNKQVTKNQKWGYIGFIIFILFLIYGSSITNEFVRWDDGLLIYENPAIWSINFQNLLTIFTTYDPELYIPMTLLSYQIDYAISGTNAGFYHLHSLLLHAINAILIGWLAWLLSHKKFIAIFCGIAFAIHPLNTEAVAWASGRKDVLSTAWILLSLCLFLFWKNKKNTHLYWVSIGCFAIALMSKVTVAVLPVLLLLIDWKMNRKITRDVIREKIPYFILSIVFGIIALGGKQGVIESTSTLDKIVMVPKSALFYIEKFLAPVKLTVLYPLSSEISATSLEFVIPTILLVLLAILTIGSLTKTKDVFFGMSFFFISIFVALFHFAKGDFLYFASDRYAYLPIFGLIWIVSVGVYTLWNQEKYKTIVTSICIALMLLFSYWSHKQSLVWANTETLFQHTITHYPESVVAHNNLGNYYLQRTNTAVAREHYTEARRLLENVLPENQFTPRALSKVLANIGTSYVHEGKMEQAEQLIKKAIALSDENAQAQLSLGILESRKGNVILSEQAYKKAIELKPGFSTAHINLGALYAGIGQYGKAIESYKEAININPFYAQAYFNKGVAHARLQQERQAIEAYEKAVELQPTFIAARTNLGILYANRNAIEESIEQFTIILSIDPTNSKARSALNQLQ